MTNEKFLNIVEYIAHAIVGTKYEHNTYVVGGAVRDYVMGNEIKDIDLVVSLENGGISIADYFDKNGFLSGSVITYPRFGTAMFRLKEFPDEEIEVVHTRKEYYPDENSRNPKQTFGTIQEDCFRRDLTINALYMKVDTKEICDFTNKGIFDIEKNIIRVTNPDANKIFQEDPLRILRVIRFANRYDWAYSSTTMNAMIVNKERLTIISKERIQDEFNKILLGNNAGRALEELNWYGFMPYIFVGYESSTIKDTINGIRKDLATRLTYMFIASVFSKKEVSIMLKDLRYGNDIIKRVYHYMDCYDYLSYIEDEYEIHSRKFITKCKNRETFDAVFEMAKVYKKEKFDTKFYDECIHQLESGKWSFDYKMPINGDDVKIYFPERNGKEISKTLNIAMMICYEEPKITKEELIEKVKQMEL